MSNGRRRKSWELIPGEHLERITSPPEDANKDRQQSEEMRERIIELRVVDVADLEAEEKRAGEYKSTEIHANKAKIRSLKLKDLDDARIDLALEVTEMKRDEIRKTQETLRHDQKDGTGNSQELVFENLEEVATLLVLLLPAGFDRGKLRGLALSLMKVQFAVGRNHGSRFMPRLNQGYEESADKFLKRLNSTNSVAALAVLINHLKATGYLEVLPALV